ncbi:cryptochrome/photolyase family protein [Cellulomonas xiejunii]|uniref:DNA photolyase family protein n=1 Tax=Cellulomonas xiejunii TaxID=2968083 RepID=A0ABY5KR48_9CELL|nr:deoxyribodipyrimidine photo-lyase [Cellulomonas xiejunii]MCC2321634.1 DNA photolyase family protein [Cellulomonas xiejunii]UUI72949.1 DNA photolyase family protein [Cellulomonas xiejunii]
MVTICWFRRDLRLADHPALVAATTQARAQGDEVVALFVVDPALWRSSGAPRLAYLTASLRALDEATGGRLVVRHGRAEDVVPAVAHAVGAASVHVSAATEPYGRRRDDAVEAALGAVPLVRTGCPYAVAPGRLRTGQGTPYQVFTPFRTAWLDHGWHDPAPRPRAVPWATLASDGVPDAPPTAAALPSAGEQAARERWHAFLHADLPGYDVDRNRPDLDVTSWMSVHLKHGEIHPRTMLADLAAAAAAASDRDGALATSVATYRSELAWREFHADVLWHRPDAARRSLRPVVPEDAWTTGPDADRLFEAWAEGRTGYPLVDAGMRQLRAQAWVHNRVRMVVASFLVKDLHIAWQRGAAHFMDQLVDGDVPQNQLNWQWVAGTGRDAAPYFRVFNPVTQGRTFDPDGGYVRRWVPELRDVPGGAVHEPWKLPGGLPAGYPERVVDHAREREVALADHARRPT